MKCRQSIGRYSDQNLVEMRDSSQTYDVVAIGQITLDHIRCDSGDFKNVIGGSALYPAVTVAKLGGKVGLVGRIGHDFPSAELESIARCGVDIAGVTRHQGRNARLSLAYRGPRLESISFELGAAQALSVEDIPFHFYSASAFYFGSCPPHSIIPLISQISLRVRDPIFAFSPKEDFVTLDEEMVHDVASRMHVIFMNEKEAALYTRRRDIRAAADAVRKSGSGTVVITRGDRGAFILTDKGATEVTTRSTPIVCPTGAGDSWVGTFLLSRLRGHSTRESARLASKVAARAVQGVGPRPTEALPRHITNILRKTVSRSSAEW